MLSLFRAFIFMAILDILIAVIAGGIFGGDFGLYLAFLFIVIFNIGLYAFSETLVLTMCRAKPIDELLYADLSRMIESLCLMLVLPKPKIYLIQELQANTFAVGRGPGHASIILTQSIFNILSREELMAVLAHELAHVKKYDVLINTMVAGLASAVLFPANVILYRDSAVTEENRLVKLSLPILKFLIQLSAFITIIGLSRYSEYGSDNKAAKIVGSGSLLSSALIRMNKSALNSPMNVYPALASLFICDPFGGTGERLFEQFSTQPNVEERVMRLEKK